MKEQKSNKYPYLTKGLHREYYTVCDNLTCKNYRKAWTNICYKANHPKVKQLGEFYVR